MRGDLRSHAPAGYAVRAGEEREQQAALMLVGRRDALVRRRTQLTNSIRGYAAEFGLIAAKGRQDRAVARPHRGGRALAVPGQGAVRRLCRGLCPAQAADRRHRAPADCLAQAKRAEPAPGGGARHRAGHRLAVGHEGGRSTGFRSGRDFAAWIGLTPKDHSTAGKTRLGVITQAGDEALRAPWCSAPRR